MYSFFNYNVTRRNCLNALSSYGLSVLGHRVRLSLLKSGGHPDPRGDKGIHTFTHSILPHAGPFSVESVVRPAYELNTPLIAHIGATCVAASLLAPLAGELVVETVKPAESGESVVVRLYDAAGATSRQQIQPLAPLTIAGDTNLLEDVIDSREWPPPFGIRTVLLGAADVEPT